MQVPHWSLAQSFEPHRSHTALIPEHSLLGISGSHGKRAEICIEVPSVCPGVFLAHPSHIPCPSMGCVLFMNPSNPLVLPPLKELREGAGHKCKFNREITLGYHWIQKDVPDIPHFGFGNFHVQILWLKRWKDSFLLQLVLSPPWTGEGAEPPFILQCPKLVHFSRAQMEVICVIPVPSGNLGMLGIMWNKANRSLGRVSDRCTANFGISFSCDCACAANSTIRVKNTPKIPNSCVFTAHFLGWLVGDAEGRVQDSGESHDSQRSLSWEI